MRIQSVFLRHEDTDLRESFLTKPILLQQFLYFMTKVTLKV